LVIAILHGIRVDVVAEVSHRLPGHHRRARSGQPVAAFLRDPQVLVPDYPGLENKQNKIEMKTRIYVNVFPQLPFECDRQLQLSQQQ
jgi:hypothetical protein